MSGDVQHIHRPFEGHRVRSLLLMIKRPRRAEARIGRRWTAAQLASGSRSERGTRVRRFKHQAQEGARRSKGHRAMGGISS
jgi:hypothetical protein